MMRGGPIPPSTFASDLVDGEPLPAAVRDRVARELPEHEVVDRLLGQMAHAEQPRADRREHLPGLGPLGRRRHDGPRPLRDVAHREQVERHLVARLLGRRGRRQDQVRVARGLVDVEVDRDEEVEARERALELRRSSRRCAADWS